MWFLAWSNIADVFLLTVGTSFQFNGGWLVTYSKYDVMASVELASDEDA